MLRRRMCSAPLRLLLLRSRQVSRRDDMGPLTTCDEVLRALLDTPKVDVHPTLAVPGSMGAGADTGVAETTDRRWCGQKSTADNSVSIRTR